MAELLVRAKPHWMDIWTPAQVEKLSPEARAGYEARTQIGDIIVVRPDGWQWGREECLPNFVVVRVAGLNFEAAREYGQSLEDMTDITKPVLLKTRKHRIPELTVQSWVNARSSSVVISAESTAAFTKAIIVKVK